jgi:hypothetical protein
MRDDPYITDYLSKISRRKPAGGPSASIPNFGRRYFGRRFGGEMKYRNAQRQAVRQKYGTPTAYRKELKKLSSSGLMRPRPDFRPYPEYGQMTPQQEEYAARLEALLAAYPRGRQ